jgi:hypothetical protein
MGRSSAWVRRRPLAGGLTAKTARMDGFDPCPALAEAIEDERPGAGHD